jgi:hypothetical protein
MRLMAMIAAASLCLAPAVRAETPSAAPAASDDSLYRFVDQPVRMADGKMQTVRVLEYVGKLVAPRPGGPVYAEIRRALANGGTETQIVLVAPRVGTGEDGMGKGKSTSGSTRGH